MRHERKVVNNTNDVDYQDFCMIINHALLMIVIIHQTHYEKSDWLRVFNQFTIACELDMINAISAADKSKDKDYLLFLLLTF